MGNSVSDDTRFGLDADEVELPVEFGLMTEDGKPLGKKGQKAMREIRKIMEKKQPLEMWHGQLIRANSYMEERRMEVLTDPDVQHASRLQRKLRASPREKIGKRSVSAPERLASLSRRKFVNALDFQLSRTQSVLEIEMAHWFGLRVDDLAHRAYLKYFAVSPLIEEFDDSDDEEFEEYPQELYTDEDGDLDEPCTCQCHHHSCCDTSNNPDPSKEKFIEDTVSHVLEFKKLLGDKAMKSRKKSERNAHAAKINETVKNFIQHTTSHFFKKFNTKNQKTLSGKISAKNEISQLTKTEKLLALKNKIIPYKGRSSSKEFFNEFFEDFLKTHDDCDCEFVRDRKCVSEVSIMEVAIHAQHHLQAVQRVKDLFLELIRQSPDEIKECPIEMQLMYQCFANNLLDDEAMEGVIEYDNEHFDFAKSPTNGMFEKINATFEAPGLNIGSEAFGSLPLELQKAMEEMISSKQVRNVVVRQSITVNRQAMKKLTKK